MDLAKLVKIKTILMMNENTENQSPRPQVHSFIEEENRDESSLGEEQSIKRLLLWFIHNNSTTEKYTTFSFDDEN